MANKLILADDSITIQKVVSLTFAEEDFEVVCAGNGEIAIQKIEEIQPDIVLADIFMPRQTGYEVCEYVKTKPSLSHIPVLLLVGTFEPFDKKEASRVGADGYLTKPFETTVLIQMVKDAIKKAEKEKVPGVEGTVSPRLEPGFDATIQASATEMQSNLIEPPPEISEEEKAILDDVLETPDFAPPEKLSDGFDATVITTTPVNLEKELGPEEILLADDEISTPSIDELSEEAPAQTDLPGEIAQEAAPAEEMESISTGAAQPEIEEERAPLEIANVDSEITNDEEVLEVPSMDQQITMPSEEDILGIFELIHLDEIIARQQTLEQAIQAEMAETPVGTAVAVQEPIAVEQTEVAEEIQTVEEAVEAVPEVEKEPVPVMAPSTGAMLDEQMVEKIARMVVEKLSEKMIQDIIWEVVPDLAELMIRAEIEKMNQEGKL